MDRIYHGILREHLRNHRQMAFLAGPRQVGKTTAALDVVAREHYLNWDRRADARRIAAGPDAVAEALNLRELRAAPLPVAFDELHKFGRWKGFLKGFFDTYEAQCRIVVTGSARLNVYKRGGDSLLGRYFPYRMHPLSLRELGDATVPQQPVRPPCRPADGALAQLLRYGGFPEPFLKASPTFHARWARLRGELLLREDVRDLTAIHELGQLSVLAQLIEAMSGQLVNYSNLASEVGVSVVTAQRWVAALESLCFCFTVRPWFRNVAKSLRKQPKVFLWDWSIVPDAGARRETLVAMHLLKAVNLWEDLGWGRFALHYLRDKAQREVDFVVVRDQQPWFLVEVKSSGQRPLNPNLAYFQGQTGAAQAFQVAFDMPYVEQDCFAATAPIRVPAATFLSQLV